MNMETGLQTLTGAVPEQEKWRMLQDVIAAETELDDETIGRLNSHMQGFLFLQEYIGNRKARIAFARSPVHMSYLRDAAGSRNVWMNDAEFNELIDDVLALLGRQRAVVLAGVLLIAMRAIGIALVRRAEKEHLEAFETQTPEQLDLDLPGGEVIGARFE